MQFYTNGSSTYTGTFIDLATCSNIRLTQSASAFLGLTPNTETRPTQSPAVSVLEFRGARLRSGL